MRTKEFFICVAILTIIYIIFFMIVDLITDKRTMSGYNKKIKNIVNVDIYIKFARFYGFESAISNELLFNIQSFCLTISYPAKMSEIANKFSISQYELIVCLLFFEYFDLFPTRAFYFDNDMICNPNSIDLNVLSRYKVFFLEKKNIEAIVNVAGGNAINDVIHLNQLFLIPGVRFINGKLFYVGDLNEKN